MMSSGRISWAAVIILSWWLMLSTWLVAGYRDVKIDQTYPPKAMFATDYVV